MQTMAGNHIMGSERKSNLMTIRPVYLQRRQHLPNHCEIRKTQPIKHLIPNGADIQTSIHKFLSQRMHDRPPPPKPTSIRQQPNIEAMGNILSDLYA